MLANQTITLSMGTVLLTVIFTTFQNSSPSHVDWYYAHIR